MLLETHAPRELKREEEKKRDGEGDRSKENEREKERDEDKEGARGCEGKSGMRRRKREIDRERKSRGKGGLTAVNATGWHYAACLVRHSMHLTHPKMPPAMMSAWYNRDIVLS